MYSLYCSGGQARMEDPGLYLFRGVEFFRSCGSQKLLP